MSSTPPGERVGVDRVVVVLAGDLDPAGRLVAHRVVGAVVAERELVGVGAEREPEDLVAEADAEHRHLADQPAHDRRRRRSTAAGSPGPFERKTPSGSRASTSAAGVDAGTTSTRQPDADEVAQDRALDAEVVGDHAERRVARRPTTYGSVGGDGGDEVDAVGGRRGRGRGAHRGLVGAERAGQRALGRGGGG